MIIDISLTTKVGDIIENTYTTIQIARIIGIHSNTVRMYEDLGFIHKPLRKENGYRVFTDIHIEQFKLARTAFQIEALQGGLRKRIVEVVKLSAKGQYDEAILLTKEYITIAQTEIANANEAVDISNAILQGTVTGGNILMKRKDVSDTLGITMDTLRNWEMNGLLKVKRKENGYRVYDEMDIQKLKIIRSLRCANYSLVSILRMINALSQHNDIDVKQVLNTPNGDEEIISVCDKLIVSLNLAKTNAEKILKMLTKMKNKYSNPPL